MPEVVASETGTAQTLMTFKLPNLLGCLDKLVDECYYGVVTPKQPFKGIEFVQCL
jgi:hypothetical protein